MLVHVTGHTDFVHIASQLRGSPAFLWLDSADQKHPAARHSYICFDPVSKLICTQTDVMIDGRPEDGDPLTIMREWTSAFDAPTDPDGPPFQGGAAGYFAYEFGSITVPLFKSRHRVPGPIAQLNLYDTLIAFDHHTKRVSLISAGLRGPNVEPDADLAAARIGRILARLAEPSRPERTSPSPPHWQSQETPNIYTDHIKRTQDYIRDGDIYQANIAQTYVAEAPAQDDLFSHYLNLRKTSPAPFSAFGHFERRTIASVSPERLISASQAGEAVAQPIKGTIRQSADPKEDAQLQYDLETSVKDRAENIMIVDLLRNDLSRVCEPHTVKTPALCKLETFAGLHHLTSTVTGDLRTGQDSLDLLEAVFPGGSITGAPKLRAMEVIDELEQTPRGAFCGSLGYIGFGGAMDFNILIRTIDALEKGWDLKAGAGITLMSDPEAEYDETVLKVAKLKLHASAEEDVS